MLEEIRTITTNKDGVLLVNNTRVTLDTIIYSVVEKGYSIEEIAEDYNLDVSVIKEVIDYYEVNTEAVHAYLINRKEKAKAAREENIRRFGNINLRTK